MPPLRDSRQLDSKAHLEPAVLIGVRTPRSQWDNLEELSRLAKTAGADVKAMITQNRSHSDLKTYLGKGKVQDLIQLINEEHIELVIVDDDLSPGQVRNLEKELETRVVDRSELILDIFATHARTKQSKIQVELAQLQYASSRLKRLWTHLERQEGAGGIATRGPGEKQLEMDRRMIQKRLKDLKQQLTTVEKQMNTSRRARAGLYRVSLVGYTNAGKSTLMRALTGGQVLVQDKLFSTLDTTTRKLDTKWPPVLLSDTVGFIRKLPRHLLSSFRSTLNEVIEADLCVEVVDVSEEDFEDRQKVVKKVLESIGAAKVPRIRVFNKIDNLTAAQMHELRQLYPDAFFLSAHSGDGVETFRDVLHQKAQREANPVKIEISASEGALIADLKKWDLENTARYDGEKLQLRLYLPESEVIRYKGFREIAIEKLEF